jgi:deoxyadenosine/deoxycytidine kinase
MVFIAQKRKLFLAMAGNIGSGKTTAAKVISQTFGFELFDEPVIDNRFLGDYYQNMKRWSFTLQLEFLIKRVQHHNLISKVEKSCIQDRTLYEDPEIFAKYLHGLGYMDDRELELYFEYFDRLNRDLHRPEKVILLSAGNVSILQGRIQKRGRIEESCISLEFLEGLNAYYSVLPQILEKKYGVDLLNIDVSQVDIRLGQGQEMLLDKVQSFLHR